MEASHILRSMNGGGAVAGSRLYVARDESATVVSRIRLCDSNARVTRPWSAVVETTALVPQELDDRRRMRSVAVIFVPAVAVTAVFASYGQVEAGLGAAIAYFFGMSYLEPVLRRRRPRSAKPAPAEAHVLTSPADRAAFDRVVAVAGSISETWPSLEHLIDVAAAESMLAESLWEISGVLVRRQRLTAVLAELSRPDFAALSPTDATALELRTQLSATESALAELEIDLDRRESSLRRAEGAGRDFIREQEMRRAIRAAKESLGSSGRPDPFPADAAAELADHTRWVLTAYRELTDGLHDPPA